MEWVEKTGKSVQEAKERALDELGVAEADAEVVVLAEPKTGLFGRVRGEARVRVRVRPAEPRPKRARRARDRGRARSGPDVVGTAPEGGAGSEGQAMTTSAARRRRRRRRRAGRPAGGDGANGQATSATSPGRRSAEPEPEENRPRREAHERGSREESTMVEGVTLEEQAAVGKEFLEGLLDLYGLDAQVNIRQLDDETVELAADGEGLGVLVGPKGATIAALQDVTRTVVQKHFPNRTNRIVVDVAGYRERRIAALRRFTQQVAQEVLDTGREQSLEPMTPADRKVVHDTVVEIEGVSSSSRGEEPERFVVISPTGSTAPTS